MQDTRQDDAPPPAAAPDEAVSDEAARQAAIRRDYEAGAMPVAAVCAAHAISSPALYRLAARQGWKKRAPAKPRRRRAKPCRTKPRRGTRAQLIRRLTRAAMKQVADAEKRLTEGGASAIAEEAKTLAVLVKTLKDLDGLDTARSPARAQATDAGDGDIRDLDEFRRDLARRIEALRGGGEA